MTTALRVVQVPHGYILSEATTPWRLLHHMGVYRTRREASRRTWASLMAATSTDEDRDTDWYEYSNLLTNSELAYDLAHRF